MVLCFLHPESAQACGKDWESGHLGSQMVPWPPGTLCKKHILDRCVLES